MLEDIKYSTLKDIKLLGALELTWASRMPVQSICPEGQGLPTVRPPVKSEPQTCQRVNKARETGHHCSLHDGRPCPALLSPSLHRLPSCLLIHFKYFVIIFLENRCF